MRKATKPISILEKKIKQLAEAKTYLQMAKADMFEIKGQTENRQKKVDALRKDIADFIEEMTMSTFNK